MVSQKIVVGTLTLIAAFILACTGGGETGASPEFSMGAWTLA